MYPVVLTIPKAHRFDKSDVPLIALEIDILYWLAQSFSEEGIGEKVCRSATCINKHIGKLYIKTGHCTHAGLVAFAHEHKILFYVNDTLVKWGDSAEPEKEK
jgi:DNA-binding CsgD family transcriptional regulator